MEFLSRNKWFLLACLVIAALAHLFRYEIQPVNAETPAAYVLDRWTGQIELISEDSVPTAEKNCEPGATRLSLRKRGRSEPPVERRVEAFGLRAVASDSHGSAASVSRISDSCSRVVSSARAAQSSTAASTFVGRYRTILATSLRTARPNSSMSRSGSQRKSTQLFALSGEPGTPR